MIEIETRDIKNEVEFKIVEIVYKEGYDENDPFQCIVDTGCPKTVAGKRWMNSYVESKGENVFVRRRKENEKFKFGPSNIYQSTENRDRN